MCIGLQETRYILQERDLKNNAVWTMKLHTYEQHLYHKKLTFN